MIKSIIQYIKDVKHTMSFSTMDDVIWIYVPIVVVFIATIKLGLFLFTIFGI